MPSGSLRTILPVVALVILISIAYFITQSKPAASTGIKVKPQILNVDVVPVEARTFQFEIASFGRLQAKTQTDLFPLVSGRIESVSPKFVSGGFFDKGDILLEIERADFEVALQVAKSDLARAELMLAEEEARHEQAKRDWNKQTKPGVATDLALRLPQLKSAKADLETAKAQLKLAELNLARTKVYAPYEGRLLQKMVDIGSVVGPSIKLASIYASDVVEVRLPISNTDLPFVLLPDVTQVLNPLVKVANLLFDPIEYWQGKLVRTEAALDESSQQLFVVSEIASPFDGDITSPADQSNRHPLKIGQYVRAIIEGKKRDNAIVVDNAHVYQGSYVYIVKNERIERRPVSVLWRNEKVSVLDSGLEPGDLLVTTLLGQVSSGTKVTIISDNAERGPAL